MGQSEKVEGAVPIGRRLVGVGPPERYQRRLRWMNAQPQAGKPLGEYSHEPTGVCFQFTSDDKVIGKTYQEASSLQPWPYFAFKPVIQDMMEEYIGEYG